MKVTRRVLLKKIWRTGVKTAGLGAVLTAAHKLLKPRPDKYPYTKETTVSSRGTLESIRLIRPPGAVDEKPFLAGCIRCYRCQDACEIGAVQFFSERHRQHYHSPYIDPARKACNVCMKCTKVCPTGVLKPMEIADRAKVNMGSVELQKDLCLSHKAKRIRDEQALLMELERPPTETEAPYERRGPCGECHMFCPMREHAIRLEPGAFLAPEVFPDHCIGCGLCEEICRVLVRGEPAIRVVPTRKAT